MLANESGMSFAKMVAYMTVQNLGALAAGFTARAVRGSIGYPHPRDDANLLIAWELELIATFFLAFVVLQVRNLPTPPSSHGLSSLSSSPSSCCRLPRPRPQQATPSSV